MIVDTAKLELSGTVCDGVTLHLANANLVMIEAPHGLLACGYLNIETAERLNTAMAIVTGVKTCEDMLQAKVVKVSTAAQARGVQIGMTGQAALACLK